MILYLYGPDSYRRQEKLKEILAKYQEKHSGLTMERFILEAEEDLLRLKEFLSEQSLFGGSKLVIVYCNEEPKELADFLKTIVNGNSALNLVLLADKHLGKGFNFLLKKPVLSQEFDQLRGASLAAFVRKEAAERGLKIPAETINDLIRGTADTWTIVNELDKLALGGKLESGPAYPNFFSLLQRLKSGLAKTALPALSQLLDHDDPAAVFNILASQADRDLKIKMADYDAAIKSGKMGYEEALLDLVISD